MVEGRFRVGRALAASGLTTAGFVVVFGIFGLLSVPLLICLVALIGGVFAARRRHVRR